LVWLPFSEEGFVPVFRHEGPRIGDRLGLIEEPPVRRVQLCGVLDELGLGFVPIFGFDDRWVIHGRVVDPVAWLTVECDERVDWREEVLEE
jgi:hypothetical protein